MMTITMKTHKMRLSPHEEDLPFGTPPAGMSPLYLDGDSDVWFWSGKGDRYLIVGARETVQAVARRYDGDDNGDGWHHADMMKTFSPEPITVRELRSLGREVV